MITKRNFDPQCITYSQMNVIFNARIYYWRLTTWARAYLLSRHFGIEAAEELFGRLYLESLQIGNMLEIIFGREYSDHYSQLAAQFPIELRDLVDAQLEGNTKGMQESVDRLYLNINQRASFLAGINPYWSEAEYKNLFGSYIQHMIELANAIAAQDFSKDMEVYDELTELTDQMGDTFAQGIYEYITTGQPAGSLGPEHCITYEEMDNIYNIRMLWFKYAAWVRNYMQSRYRGIGNEQEVLARLRSLSANYTANLKKVFGENPAIDGLQQELDAYIDLLSAFITAEMQGNTDETGRITQQLYQNADKRAAYLTSLNPYWNEEEWRTRLYNNLRDTIDESTSFLTGDYSRNIDIFNTLLSQAEDTSNYFAQGLFSYIKFTR